MAPPDKIGSPETGTTGISVMTQNQYLGGDLAPLLRAPPDAFNDALVAALRQISDNQLPQRAERLAELIAERRPHLVGLQEVWLFECLDLTPPLPGMGCRDPSIAGAFNDHLSETLSAVAARGEPYHAVAIVENLDLRDVQAPGLPPGVPFVIDDVPALLRALDRVVILVRADIVAKGTATPVDFFCPRPSENGCNFQTFRPVKTPAGPLVVERGYVGVDLTVDDVAYRFVNTHLEIQQPDPADRRSGAVQAAQAAELIGTLAVTTPADRPLIVAGDINSSPFHLPPPGAELIVPPYQQFVASGYVDVWTSGSTKASGLTCCQQADLSNTASLLDERIDMIFARDVPVAVNNAEVVGDRIATPPPHGPPRWPSDHASVTAEILF